MPLSIQVNTFDQVQVRTNTRTKPNNNTFGVKIVEIIYLMKQDNSKVKITR